MANLPGGPPVSSGSPVAPGVNPVGSTAPAANPSMPMAIAATTVAIQQNTGAINENAAATEKWARLQENQHKTFSAFLKEEIDGMQKAAAAAGGYRRYISEATTAMTGMIQKMQTATSLSTVYDNALKQLSTGTAHYTASLQANTSAIGDATQQSTAFVTGLRDAQAQSHELAAQYNMDAGAIAEAGQHATQMFATQLAAIGDVGEGIKSLQKESVVFSRFFGTDMKDVMQAWQERMEHSNMTLTEAKDETAMLAKVADQYAISLGKLGDKMLQTAQLGKREFLEMARQINQEFRLGVPNVVAYTAAMAKMSLEAAKKSATKMEQANTREGLLKLMNDMTSTEGTWGVMAHKAAQTAWQQFQTAPGSMTTQARTRLEARREDIATAGAQGNLIGQNKLIMEALKGTADAAKLSLQKMRESTGGNVQAMAMMLNQGGVSMTSAMDIAKGVATGSIEEVFEKNKEALMGEAQAQKTETEKLVDAGAKTNSTLHSIAKDINAIHHWLIGMTIGSPIMSMLGTAVGGAVLSKVLGGGVAGGGLLAKLLGVGGAAAPGSAGFIGPMMPGAAGAGWMASAGKAAAMAGNIAVPTALAAAAAYGGYKIYQAHDQATKMSTGGRRVETGDVLHSQLDTLFQSGTARAVANGILHVFGQSGKGGITAGMDAGWQTREVVTTMTHKELAAQRTKITLLEKDIKDKESNGKALSDLEQQEIAVKKRKLAAEKAKIAAIDAQSKKESAPMTDQELDKARMEGLKFAAGRIASGANAGGLLGSRGSIIANKDTASSAEMASQLVGQLGLGVNRTDSGSTLQQFLRGGSAEAAALMKKLQAKGISREAFESDVDIDLKRRQVANTGVDVTKMDIPKVFEEWGRRVGHGTSVTGLTTELRDAIQRGYERRAGGGGGGITGVDQSSDLSEVRKNPDGSLAMVTTMKVTTNITRAGAGMINAVGADVNSPLNAA